MLRDGKEDVAAAVDYGSPDGGSGSSSAGLDDGADAAMGLAVCVTTNISCWNWYHFPSQYTPAYMSIEFVGYLAA